MHTRNSIERAILTAIVYYNGYPKIAHVLTPQNFTTTDSIKNREIFTAAAKLFPSRPIDLLTMVNELRQLYPDSQLVLDELYAMTLSFNVNAHNVTYWSLILLQIDIKDKFRKELLCWRAVREAQGEHAEEITLKEILEISFTDADVFEFIEKATLYLKQMEMHPEYEDALEFNQNVASKAFRIRQVDSINIILQNLYTVAECSDYQVQNECAIFAKAIADMVTTGQTNSRYTQAVNLIYR